MSTTERKRHDQTQRRRAIAKGQTDRQKQKENNRRSPRAPAAPNKDPPPPRAASRDRPGALPEALGDAPPAGPTRFGCNEGRPATRPACVPSSRRPGGPSWGPGRVSLRMRSPQRPHELRHIAPPPRRCAARAAAGGRAFPSGTAPSRPIVRRRGHGHALGKCQPPTDRPPPDVNGSETKPHVPTEWPRARALARTGCATSSETPRRL
mmetsp:Transcript_53724/g.89380  ORF Transcript_53724/g.89380 Transcript_53724/m.89380 type:complete len:208 (-) Transcript_53724:1453-2076(-)